MNYTIVVCKKFYMPCKSLTFYEWISRFQCVYGVKILYENKQLNYYSEFQGYRTLIGFVKEITHHENYSINAS